MKLGVFSPVLAALSFKEMIEYLSSLGVEQVEMGAGGCPGKAHFDPEVLLADDKKIDEIKKILADNNIKTDIDVDSVVDQQPTDENKPAVNTVSGNIADIRTAVINGDSCYYLKLEGGNVYYAVFASDFEAVVIANKGNSVEITHKESSDSIIKAESFKLN